MPEDKLKKTFRQAEQAQALLNDSLLTDAWSAVEGAIHKMWAGTKSEDAEGREALYRELHGLKAVRARLEQTIKAGKLAAYELEKEKHGH